jgi:putative DNA primase/helicase
MGDEHGEISFAAGGQAGRREPGALADGHRPSDIGNASRLVAAADGRIRFVSGNWGQWIVYRDGRWVDDPGEVAVTEIAKQVPRRMLQLAVTLNGRERDDLWQWAKRSEAASRLAAMVRLARGINGVETNYNDLDADPYLLNAPNGTIDLRTGQLLEHNPEHLLTLQTPALYAPEAGAPAWDACVQRWQPDPDRRDYLQRAVGSGVTGQPVDKFFVNVGDGGNGKSQFFGAIAAALGDYHVIPHKSLLIAQRHDQHDTVKADLFRTRIAVAAETDQGARLDESKIKDLTGGDLLAARRMYENPWKFAPTWTLFLHTNHRPQVRDLSEGIWRRLRLIRWTVTIPERERDPKLAGRLAAEASGILNWLVAGSLAWQERGLAEPAAIATDTDAWRLAEDSIGRWLAERAVIGPAFHASSVALRESYGRWCDRNGERAGTAKALGAELERRGFQPARTDTTRGWAGVGLRADDDEVLG